ncbi:MAG: GAF domain-containing protein [Tannerella sp.]|jgi:GAF domain-containing protein|nr:GAF domain-containing protein [Tannerella sp.]
MAENIHIPPHATKEARYRSLLPQIDSLTARETDPVANLANTAAALMQTFRFLWTGFYLARDGELVLGPFQGPVACTRIAFGRGVCGTAWKERRTIIVPDVAQFPGHIACSTDSKSEIVVPLFGGEHILGVLDIDSDRPNDFDATDALYLSHLARSVAAMIGACK